MNETKRKTHTSADRNFETDVIVLGVGTSGEDLSLQLLNAGLDVVGIEAALVGGECAYWACLPSKVMIRAADTIQEAYRVSKLAGNVKVTPNWDLVASQVRETTGGWDDTAAFNRYEERGGKLVHGHGKLTGPRSVAVGDKTFTARRGIVIATGSKPAIPRIPGLADVDFWTTHDVIQLERLPKSMVVLGAGTVGCELGQVLSRFGVDVTIVEAKDRLLPAEEPEASEGVEAAFTAEGINVNTNATIEQVESRHGKISITLAGGKELTSERLLIASGRTIDLSNLGLESAGLDSIASYNEVDEQMRAAEGIWAMGDVNGKAMFTHVALYQSAIIAADTLGKEYSPARYDAVPRATFTDPEVGAVGMTETEALEKGIDVVTTLKQVPATFRGWLHGADDGIIKLIVDRS